MSSTKIELVSLDRLVCLPQVRASTGFSEKEIGGLAQSITEAGGILQPLLVRREGDTLIVLDGERRLRAAKKAGLAVVPVIIEEEALTEGQVLHRQLVIDAQRIGLSPMDRSRAIQKLMAATGWSAREVAVKLGTSAATVSKLLALTILPTDVQDAVGAGRLAMSTAYGLARIADPVERETLTREALSGRVTREEVAKRVKKQATGASPSKPRRKPRTPRERVVIGLGDGCSVAVAGPSLSVDGVVAWFAGLAERIKRTGTNGRSLAEVVKLISTKDK